MAKATRPDGIVDRDTLPDGVKVFTVINATIIDSLGAYCTEGQEAALNERDAKAYHKNKQIQVALPDFAQKTPTAKEAQAALDALKKLDASQKDGEDGTGGEPGKGKGGEAQAPAGANRSTTRA